MEEFPKLIIQYPLELWYEKKWIITIFGVIVGALIGGIIQLISGVIKKSKLKKEITRNLSVEVYTNRSNNFKALPKIQEVLESFKLAIDNHYQSGHPSVVFTGIETTRKFFDLYCPYLSLFNKYFFVRIYSFYQHCLPCVEAGAKRAENQFKRFYKSDSMISAKDVISNMNEYITNIQMLIKQADEITAELILVNKELGEISRDEKTKHQEKNKKIDGYLNTLKVGTKFDIDSLTNELKIIPVEIILRILKNKSIKRINVGEYIKTKK